jgi:ABC-type lipoprotein export system ATPase subunit
MVLLVYGINENAPVIIMGDTGCGKTALITVLNQIINNGGTTLNIEKMSLVGQDGKLRK